MDLEHFSWVEVKPTLFLGLEGRNMDSGPSKLVGAAKSLEYLFSLISLKSLKQIGHLKAREGMIV